MPQAKATKKFERNKLKDVLKRRKDHAKVKQRAQMSAKRKERRARDNAPAEDLDGDIKKKAKSKNAEDASIGEMSMDQFFQGGFQVPELTKKNAAKPKTGKRKRTPVNKGSSSDSEEEVVPSAPSDSASESESDDDPEAHKKQLAALADKDPEFYKYLKENDSELLDFEEDADLDDIDSLSASEDEGTPRKKQKSSKDEDIRNEVTKKLVEKWNSSMESSFSLRATKEVVLAFRAAAHLNDDGQKKYKYSISDPDGMLRPIMLRLGLTQHSSISPTSHHYS